MTFMKSLLMTFFILLLMQLSTAGSAEFPSSSDLKLIRNGLDFSLGEKYYQADSCYQLLIDKYPQHPAGYYFLATQKYNQMKEGEHFRFEEQYYDYLDKTVDLADDMRRRDRQNAWAYYFMGSAFFYRAMYDHRKGGKLSVVRNSIRGKNLIKRCLKYNPEIYDAYVSLGSYNYWGSVETRDLSWLPFFGDNSEQGLKQLELAHDSALFSRRLTETILIYVYTEERRFERAAEIFYKLYELFPESCMPLWAGGEMFFKAEKYDSALLIYDTLVNRIHSQDSYNNHNLYQACYYRAQCHYEMKKYADALKQVEYCDSIPLTEDVRDNLKSYREELRNLRKRLLETR